VLDNETLRFYALVTLNQKPGSFRKALRMKVEKEDLSYDFDYAL
jgi:hypothetical protein